MSGGRHLVWATPTAFWAFMFGLYVSSVVAAVKAPAPWDIVQACLLALSTIGVPAMSRRAKALGDAAYGRSLLSARLFCLAAGIGAVAWMLDAAVMIWGSSPTIPMDLAAFGATRALSLIVVAYVLVTTRSAVPDAAPIERDHTAVADVPRNADGTYGRAP